MRRVIWEEQGRLGLPLSKVGTLKLMTSENEITDEVTIHHQAKALSTLTPLYFLN